MLSLFLNSLINIDSLKALMLLFVIFFFFCKIFFLSFYLFPLFTLSTGMTRTSLLRPKKTKCVSGNTTVHS